MWCDGTVATKVILAQMRSKANCEIGQDSIVSEQYVPTIRPAVTILRNNDPQVMQVAYLRRKNAVDRYGRDHKVSSLTLMREEYQATKNNGRAMAHTVICRPVTAESWLRAHASQCEICGGQSGTGAGFSTSSSVFPCQYHSANALHTHVAPGRWTIGPLVAAVQSHSLTSSTWTTTKKEWKYFKLWIRIVWNRNY
jgi:hypothetical protein